MLSVSSTFFNAILNQKCEKTMHLSLGKRLRLLGVIYEIYKRGPLSKTRPGISLVDYYLLPFAFSVVSECFFKRNKVFTFGHS